MTVLFNKDYYYLSEVAELIETPESNLIHAASRGEIELFVVFKSVVKYTKPFLLTNMLAKKEDQTSFLLAGHLYRICISSMSPLQVNLLSEFDSVKCPYLEVNGEVLRGDIKKRISWKDIVIKVDDVSDLVKRHYEETSIEEQGIEELQTENEALKQRIIELEESQALATCEISSKSKAPIAATFKAIRALVPELTIDTIERQTQLDGNSVSRSTIANYLNGKI